MLLGSVDPQTRVQSNLGRKLRFSSYKLKGQLKNRKVFKMGPKCFGYFFDTMLFSAHVESQCLTYVLRNQLLK